MSETIGVDVGGTKVLAGRVRADGTVVARAQRPTDRRSSQALLQQIVDLVAELRTGAETTIEGIGVGLPGTIDQRRGVLVQAANLPIAEAPARDLLHIATGVRVEIENDAGCAALAEHRHGAGQGRGSSVMLTLGTGVGGGVVIEGRPFRGSTGAGAELGHIVVERGGRPCQGSCPGRGHLEAYCSGTALGRAAQARVEAEPHGALARAAAGRAVDAHLVLELAEAGEPEALLLLEDVGDALGAGLVTLAHAFEPEVLVIGGGFGMAARDWILERARHVLRTGALHPMAEVPVVAALLGADAGMLGAAALPLVV